VKTSFTLISNIITAILTLLLYYLPDIAPQDFPIGAFLTFLIPLFILFNLFFILTWLFKRPLYLSLLSLIVILIGYKFIDRSIAIGKPTSERKDFRVLNCNVRIFNVYDHLRDKDYSSSKKMMKWVTNFNTDIACLQEFYHSETDSIFFSQQIISKKYPYFYFEPFLIARRQHFGMAIFSKHPIVNKGEIKFRENSNNQIIFCDIKIGKEIVRVYNIHLQSMAIDENDIVNSRFTDESRGKWVNILLRYKNGSIQRGRQVDQLVQHIKSCAYKVVVCGDLNEPPYGYAYEQLSDQLDNAFQKAGQGFGVTYNGKLPLLRIDNQFYSKGLKVNKFTIHNEMTYSDHYPISASYVFDRP
jgi:endonuclease/exonuclease/phosphatase family metal-dependent hydrolase